MYWYLSFLRPPPVSISLAAGSVTITPQVANDLRTELRDEPTDISYVWQRSFPVSKAPQQPVHLTTFINPSSTYKPLSIPLPRSTKIGEKWRLGLISTSAPDVGTSQRLLDVSAPAPGVMSVWSESIEIKRGEGEMNGTVRSVGGKKSNGVEKKDKGGEKGKVAGEGPKQTRISRDWELPDTGLLRVIEQTSFDLDKKIWDSGLALASWLWRYLPKGVDSSGVHPLVAESFAKLLGDAEVDVVELESTGSGTGVVSIALAQILERHESVQADWSTREDIEGGRKRIGATDLPSAMELMQENLELNGFTNATNSKSRISLQARVLDWDEAIPSWVKRHPGGPDLVIAADVSYNTASFPALVRTLDETLQSGTLIFAYKKRDDAERELWGLLEGKGIWMTLVDKVQGSEVEGETEIWVGSRSRDERFQWGLSEVEVAKD